MIILLEAEMDRSNAGLDVVRRNEQAASAVPVEFGISSPQIGGRTLVPTSDCKGEYKRLGSRFPSGPTL
jgi:hypothetical protein